MTIVRHLPGQHDQSSHAGGKAGAAGAGGGTGTKDDPIRTSDVTVAQQALADGKYVELSSERQVSTLVDRLAADINDARAKGETRDYDLCRVSVPKTNLFCSQNVGIPRAQIANVSPELAAQIQAQVESVVPGLTPDAMDANIERALVAGMADPTNNGATWYAETHDASTALADRDGITIEQSTGVIAALSPQQQWDDNLACADYVSKTLSRDDVVRLDADTAKKAVGELTTERYAKNQSDPSADLAAGTKRLSEYTPRQQAVILKAMGQRDGVKSRWTCGADGVEKAVRIHHGESPADVLGGHKVRSFYNNILAPGNPGGYVTIDTHAISAAAGQKITSGDPRMTKLMGVPERSEYGSKGTYGAFADAYRRVAEKYDLNPSQVQAIAWVEWRKNNP